MFPPIPPQTAGAAQESPAELACDARNASAGCIHCGQPLRVADLEGFCCAGCRAVHRVLTRQGLTRFYDLRGAAAVPVGELGLERRGHAWLVPLQEQLRSGAPAGPLRMQVQGLHCAACVWLIEELFRRRCAHGEVLVNPTRGSVQLRAPSDFELLGFVRDVEAVGYLMGPLEAARTGARDDLLLRTGVCAALAANSMLFSAALYLGLEAGPLHDFLRSLNFAFATLTVIVGGPVFFHSAWQALRRGVAHLDLPIAVGILLTFVAAVWSYASGNRFAAYHDSLAVFITLMLVGRYLQERVLERNRRQLLAGQDLDALRMRVIRGERLQFVRAGELVAGDRILIVPGDIVPVLAELEGDTASCSLDWINGESAPQHYLRGAAIPAGAFNIGTRAFSVRARSGFSGSPLESLLRTPEEPADRSSGTGYRHFAAFYVLTVLVLGAGGFVYWALVGGGLTRGLEVATAVFVVTCPCAIGIAMPLARELAHARLRALGIFVRRGDFMERARRVRRVVFDKTGTLTTGALELDDPRVIEALDPQSRSALHAMTCRSLHPRSLAIRRSLDAKAPPFDAAESVVELAGRGLSLHRAGHHYRLGSASWLGFESEREPSGAVYFVRGTSLLARIDMHEAVRPDAAAELSALQRAGYETWILSGDVAPRVAAFAREVGHDPQRSLGGATPEDKARWIGEHDRGDTLMVGDGINDSLAVQAAYCSATPSIDRSFMPSRSDFYFVTPGIGVIAQTLRMAARLARVQRRSVVFALVYNAGTVAVALLGYMQPWVAAVLMPLSSLAVVGMTLAAFSQPRSATWKS